MLFASHFKTNYVLTIGFQNYRDWSRRASSTLPCMAQDFQQFSRVCISCYPEEVKENPPQLFFTELLTKVLKPLTAHYDDGSLLYFLFIVAFVLCFAYLKKPCGFGCSINLWQLIKLIQFFALYMLFILQFLLKLGANIFRSKQMSCLHRCCRDEI